MAFLFYYQNIKNKTFMLTREQFIHFTIPLVETTGILMVNIKWYIYKC